MTYEPKHLERWHRPLHFMQHVDDWFYTKKAFVFLGQNRDSDSLTRSNFTCALEEIGGESETVAVLREDHWACGWVEWIAIHESDTKALEIAEKILCDLEDYPVINEDHWSELEWNEAQEYWESLPISERVDLCRDANVSIFAARHDWIPQDDSGYIFERLTIN